MIVGAQVSKDLHLNVHKVLVQMFVVISFCCSIAFTIFSLEINSLSYIFLTCAKLNGYVHSVCCCVMGAVKYCICFALLVLYRVPGATPQHLFPLIMATSSCFFQVGIAVA